MHTESPLNPLVSADAAGAKAPSARAWESQAQRAWQATASVVDVLAEALVVAALLGELCLVLANVFARAYFHHSFLWADEVARLSLSILAFIGGAVAYRRRDHAFVRIVLNLLPRPVERGCLALSDIIVLLIALLTGV